MSEHAATDYDKWFNSFDPDAERERDEAENAAYMAALEQVYQETHQWAGRWDENERQLKEAVSLYTPEQIAQLEIDAYVDRVI